MVENIFCKENEINSAYLQEAKETLFDFIFTNEKGTINKYISVEDADVYYEWCKKLLACKKDSEISIVMKEFRNKYFAA